MIDAIKLWLYRLKKPFHLVKTGILGGVRANYQYHHPFKQLQVIAVTGTDGKTTTSTLLHHILTQNGIKAGLLTTVAAKLGDQAVSTGAHVTSPQPALVMKFARECVDQGCTHLVLEITSHGYFQYRTWGIKPILLGITNITHEHLDYHVNWNEYVKAKAAIAIASQKTLMCQSAPGFSELKTLVNITTFSDQQFLTKEIKQVIGTTFTAKHNQLNAQLATALANELGVKPDHIAQAIKSFPGVPGRMEEINNTLGFRVVVDFAHTPHGLESTLQALQKQLKAQRKPGRLIAVFGSAGLRDRAKRPKMGQVGVANADLVVLTAEDPRTENVWSIIRQMKEQLVKGHDKVVSIADRTQAITFALTQAKPHDLVAVLGKGHENSMCFGKTEIPWSDRDTIKFTLAKINQI